MILELDMGNTRIKWRLHGDSGKVARGNLPTTDDWPELLAAFKTAAFQFGCEAFVPVRILVASVLGVIRNQSFSDWCEAEFAVSPEFARSQADAGGTANGYIHPEQLGVDRWLAILAGFSSVHQACVIVSCGSAITLDLVDGNGQHLGGYIAPGIKMMRRALMVETQGVRIAEQPSALSLTPGRDTEAAVSAGQGAMIYGLLDRAMSGLRQDMISPKLIITGGDAEYLLPYFPDAVWRPELVMDGLMLALPVS